jgi:hypothetical protein
MNSGENVHGENSTAQRSPLVGDSASTSPQCQPTPHTEYNSLRGLSQLDGGKKVPATMSALADAVRWAEEIMKAIDERWPAAE